MLRNKSILFVIFVFMKKVLVIDNYDSFVYNVIQLLREAVVPVGYDIVRNDKIDFSGLGDYGGILLSPNRNGVNTFVLPEHSIRPKPSMRSF